MKKDEAGTSERTMRKRYFGIFTKDGDTVDVRIPDAPTVVTYGTDITNAIDMAEDALAGIIVCGEEGKDYAASPSSYEEIAKKAQEGEIVLPVAPGREEFEVWTSGS